MRPSAAGGTRVEDVEAEGRTVNEATEKALAALNLRRDQVEITVLTEGRPRLLGFGGEPARVRVSPKPAPPPRSVPAPRSVPEPQQFDDSDEDDEEYDEDEEEEEEEEIPPQVRRAPVPMAEVKPLPIDEGDMAVAVAALENLLRLMSVDAEVEARAPETAGDGIGMIEAVLDISGDDLGILIGRRGTTLGALQYILNLVVGKQVGHRVSYGIDVDGYRRRREEALVALARRMADRVRGTGRSVTLEPMPPNERRIVHITLAEDPEVMTVSIGEGEARKVAITPTG
jgi:spoIIIJ-associated protein